MYRDDHLEWNKGILSVRTLQENTERKTDSAKLKKSLKYDFSFTNWGESTDRWLKGVKKRYTTLFPEVSKQARALAGIKVKSTDVNTDSSSSESGSDSSGRDLDSDYEGFGNASANNYQNDADGGVDAGNHQGSHHNEDDGPQGVGVSDGHMSQQSDEEADNEQDDDDGDGGIGGDSDLDEVHEVEGNHGDNEQEDDVGDGGIGSGSDLDGYDEVEGNRGDNEQEDDDGDGGIGGGSDSDEVEGDRGDFADDGRDQVGSSCSEGDDDYEILETRELQNQSTSELSELTE